MRDLPRIGPTTDLDPLVADGLRTSIAAGRGSASNLAWTLAHSPFGCEGYRGLGRVLFVQGVLAARLREVIVLRVAWNCRSACEFGNHVDVAIDSGIPERSVAELARPHLGELREDESILVDVVDELLRTDDLATSSWARLRAGWSDPELVEIVLLVGFSRMASLFADTVRVQTEEGIPGTQASRRERAGARHMLPRPAEEIARRCSSACAHPSCRRHHHPRAHTA